MKTPQSSKSKKRRKQQDSIEFTYRSFSDFQNSSSSAPSTQARELSTFSWVDDTLASTPDTPTPNRLAKLRPVVSSSPLRVHVSPSKTGEGSMTRFIDVSQPISSSPFNTPSRQTQPQSRPVVRGTGAHDNHLTRAQGNYRGPSMRRGSGMVVETPKEMRKAIVKKKKNGEWSNHPTQVSATTPKPSKTSEISKETKILKKEPLATITDWGKLPHRPQRGDIPPLVVRQPISVEASSKGILSMPERTDILNLCVAAEKDYLGLQPVLNHTEEEFWVAILQQIEHTPRNKFTDWKHLRTQVNSWCDQRRKELREGILSPPRDLRHELDTAIDSWNKIWAQRFTTLYKGYFESAIWTLVGNRVLSFVQEELYGWINTVLENRRDELDTQSRPHLLRGNNNRKAYGECLGDLQDKVKSDGLQIREAEAIMSLLVDIQPGLEKIIHQHMGQDIIDSEAAQKPIPDSENRDQSEVGQNQNDVALPSIEYNTPELSPRILQLLQSYKGKYREALRDEKKKEQRSLSIDEASTRATKKRKTSQEAKKTAESNGSQQPRVESQEVERRQSTSSSTSFLPLSEFIGGGSFPKGTTPSSPFKGRIGTTAVASNVESPVRSEIEPMKEFGKAKESKNSSYDTRVASSTRSPACNESEPKMPSRDARKPSQDMTPPEQMGPVLNSGGSEELTEKSTESVQQHIGDIPHPPNKGASGRQKGSSPWRHKNKKRYRNGNSPHRQRNLAAGTNSRNLQQPHRGGTGQPEDRNTQPRNQAESPLWFRESTVDFQAMAPRAREDMLFRAIRTFMHGERQG
ncbi:hypothetical protein G7Z17_g3735 [Cylindrodendrum hubeiense]|uniref:Uncharacterized protein n=1 Tax=Cylindrodendrum hubeiense TaxID=595255 RepID=A0A9P5HA81_9HYPO|nr:hypothetical protein G7Z17_g3735 [Cylindrodendrum hubeiense]